MEKQHRQALMRNTAIAIVSVFVVGGIIFWVANETIKGQADQKRPEANPAEQTIPEEGRDHVAEATPLTFNHYPPSSGIHYGRTADLGTLYEQPVAEGFWVHNLEHGDIVILYNCSGDCAGLKTQIKLLMAEAPLRRCDLRRILAVPYSRNMATPITVVAWGKQLDLPEFDSEAILNFYKRYEDRGPETLGCP
ncbi:MAG TPA: DUF3105 domain-containing protein [Anaerolineales bacterium]|nr:DUF3105 domain-containing protein [Anaerolineales bacterium]